jgi:DNA-binding NarL/FixJ family response regulator
MASEKIAPWIAGSTQPVRLLLVEPQSLIRHALRELLSGYEHLLVVGDAADGYEALEVAQHTRPDLVLIEMQLPGIDGVATAEQLLARQPDLAILMLTNCERGDALTRALQAGVRGYLLKHATPAQLYAAISGVLRGEFVIEQRLTRYLVERFTHLQQNRHPQDTLSERELEVLRLMVEGRRNREIAEALLVSSHTVKTHISNIFQKLGVSDRASAVLVALQRNLGGMAVQPYPRAERSIVMQ